MSLRLEPTVTLVNRLRNADGDVVPQTFQFDGESVEIVDQITVPLGVARIFIHHSMCKMDTFSGICLYKLGVPGEPGYPVDPICVDDLGMELVDRAVVPTPRQTTTGKKLGYGPPLRSPINLRGSAGPEIQNLRDADGAFPGGFGRSVDIAQT